MFGAPLPRFASLQWDKFSETPNTHNPSPALYSTSELCEKINTEFKTRDDKIPSSKFVICLNNSKDMLESDLIFF